MSSSTSELSFEALNLSPETLKAVHDMGFVRPTQVQAAAYTPVLEGHDIMVQSQTGSGKTVAYGMPLAEMLNTLDKQVQALILLPTRELANQVAEELTKLFALCRCGLRWRWYGWSNR
jgi:ATP-dependent RNA helicase DeaD